MIYLATFHWHWALITLVIGLAIGWASVVYRGAALSTMALQRGAALAAALVLIMLTRLLPGRAGYWLDLGVTLLAIYLIGCVVGALLRSVLISRHHASLAASGDEPE